MRAGVHQIVTFAPTPFEGNPAFVLSLEDGADDTLLSRVCDQLQAGVLAVIREGPAGRVELSFHTTGGLHAGAGHAAHAAAHVALRGRDRVDFALRQGGVLTGRRQAGQIGVTWPLMPGRSADRVEALAAALGRTPRETLTAPFGDVAVFADAEDLSTLEPDFGVMEALSCGAVIATAPGGPGDFALRVFAPKFGLPEDPVCGTAHRILAPFWSARLGLDHLHSRQMSPRGGDLWCTLEEDGVTIAGESVLFLEGRIAVA